MPWFEARMKMQLWFLAVFPHLSVLHSFHSLTHFLPPPWEQFIIPLSLSLVSLFHITASLSLPTEFPGFPFPLPPLLFPPLLIPPSLISIPSILCNPSPGWGYLPFLQTLGCQRARRGAGIPGARSQILPRCCSQRMPSPSSSSCHCKDSKGSPEREEKQGRAWGSLARAALGAWEGHTDRFGGQTHRDLGHTDTDLGWNVIFPEIL